MKKTLAVILSVVLVMTVLLVPVTADTVPLYPNSADFAWGVNGHNGTSSYGESSVADQMALAAKLGAKLYRVDVTSANDLNRTDAIVKEANAYGIDVMLVVGGANLSESEISTLFGQIARHYSSGDFGTVKYISVFNETDANYADEISTIAPKFKAAINAIKAANSGIKTVINFGWTREEYLADLVDAGVEFDVIGINWYTGMENLKGLASELADIAANSKINDKNIIICESNVQDGTNVLTDDLKTIMNVAYNNSKVIGMCFYELLDEPAVVAAEANYGLVSYTTENGIGDVHPIYTDIQALIGGSDSVEKGEFTPSADYPTRNEVYSLVKAFDFKISAGHVYNYMFSEAYSLDDFDTVEFDIKVETSGTADVTIPVKLQDTNYGTKSGEVTVTPNVWEHKVVSTAAFNDYGINKNDVHRFAVDGINEHGEDLVVNVVNVSFTNFAPAMNNVYGSAKPLPLNVNFTGTDPYASRVFMSESVDMTKYDYVEFDFYYETKNDGDAHWTRVFLYDTNGKRVYYDIETNANFTLTKNQWLHVVAPVSSFSDGYGNNGDKTKISYIMLDALESGVTYHVANFALTKFAPEMDNVYGSAKPLPLNVNFTGTDPYASRVFMSESVDMTKYDYVEFDFYYETKNDGDAHWTRVFLYDTNGKRVYYDIETNANFTLTKNQWLHVVVPVSSFTNPYEASADKTKISYIMLDALESGVTYHIANFALTKFAPDMNNEFTLIKALNGAINDTPRIVGNSWLNLGERVDLTSGDYLEFDMYINSANASSEKRIRYYDANDKMGYYDVTTETNKWVHVEIPVAAFNGDGNPTVVDYLGIEISNDAGSTAYANEYHLANFAITKFAPEMNTTYSLKKAISGAINDTPRGDGLNSWLSLDETVNFTAYDYLEFDMYIKSDNESSEKRILYYDANGAVGYKYVTTETNKWVHVAFPVTEFSNGGDLSKIDYLGIEIAGSPSSAYYANEYHLANFALTKFAPDMNNKFSLIKGLNGAINDTPRIVGNSWLNLGERVDLTSGDYLEFDMYINSANASSEKRIRYYDANDKMGYYDVTTETNKWVHVAIPVAAFSGNGNPTVVDYLGIEISNDAGSIAYANEYHLANFAITKFAPEMNNTYYLVKEISGAIDKATVNGTNAWLSFGETLDFTKQDFVEFDIYLVNSTLSSTEARIKFYDVAGNMGYYDIEVETNKWNHVVIRATDFILENDSSNIAKVDYLGVVMYDDCASEYHLTNVALTNETEPVDVIYGDANGDSVVDVRDYVFAKLCALGSIEPSDSVIEALDFDGDYAVTEDDLGYIRDFILGIIDVLEPVNA